MAKTTKTKKSKKKKKLDPWRPPFYKTPEEFQAKVEEYFDGGHRMKTVFIAKTGETMEVPDIGIMDLTLYLGFADRSSFYKYEHKEGFRHTVKRARSFITREYESLLRENPTAAIFALKNFGWSDKQIIENTNKNVDVNDAAVDDKADKILEALNKL